jgi:hypothetical protein
MSDKIEQLDFTTIDMIDSTDVQELTLQVYGKEFDYASTLGECSNGSLHSIGEVTSDFWGSDAEKEDALQELKCWIENPDVSCKDYDCYDENDEEQNHSINPDIIFWDLCVKGYITPGNYHIYVWW